MEPIRNLCSSSRAYKISLNAKQVRCMLTKCTSKRDAVTWSGLLSGIQDEHQALACYMSNDRALRRDIPTPHLLSKDRMIASTVGRTGSEHSPPLEISCLKEICLESTSICSGPKVETSPRFAFQLKKEREKKLQSLLTLLCFIKVSWSSKENGVSRRYHTC